MYKILRSVLFLFDPEWVHYFSMNGLKMLCRIGFLKEIIRTAFKPKGNIQYPPKGSGEAIFPGSTGAGNIQFSNKIGLAAGFDKNAKYLDELEVLGFGFVEIGTVTPLPQAGNDKPRLFRLPKDKALINRMGFNNDGVQVVAERLKKWRTKFEVQSSRFEVEGQHKSHITHHTLIIGGNIGKNKSTPNENAWKDYETCFLALHDYVDYFVVNVSSPNTPGLRELQEKESLRKILTNLQVLNAKLLNLPGRQAGPKPILLKIAPDLTTEQVDDVIELSLEIKLDGLVASNTTISRDQLQTSNHKLQAIGAGGLSGLPVKERSTELVRYIHQKTNGRIPIIASGGIFTGADAKEKFDAGASLVQVWTGFVYKGPAIVKNISTYIANNK
jgi:dihydroorotate dehydrogenase